MNQEQLGFIYCLSGQSEQQGVCIDFYFGTGCALILFGLCLYQIIIRYLKSRRIFKKKQLLFFIILLADTFFIVFTMDRSLTFAYFLYFYFDQSYLIFLVYFFTTKATNLNIYNQNKTRLVRGCAYFLLSLFTLLLISDITIYYIKHKQSGCSYITLFIVRMIELLISIVFIIGAYYLNKKMNALIIEHITFANRMTEKEKDQHNKTKIIRVKFWTLVWVTIFGQIIQWISDLAYFIHYHENEQQIQQCLLPAYNNVFTWWADLLICLFGYFLPLFCAVYLFWQRKKIVQYVESLEVESIPQRFYKPLLNRSNSTYSSQTNN